MQPGRQTAALFLAARRVNPVGLLLACDILAAGLAAVLWRTLWPEAGLRLGWLAPMLAMAVLAVVALAAGGGYRRGRPVVPGFVSPALWLGIAPAVAAPGLPGSAGAGPADGLLAAALWLAALTALLVTLGRLGLAAARPGPLGRLCAPRAVLLGDPAAAARVVQVPDAPRLLGWLGASGAAAPLPWLGAAAALPALIAAGRVDLAIVADPAGADLPALARLGLRLAALVDLPDGPRLVPLVRAPLSDAGRVVKRAVDLVGAALALAALALPMAAIALAIRLDSPGPALFRQTRAGLHGRPFRMLKFRTMRACAADPDGARQTGRDDPRLTRLGRLLRRASLDELPQLVNVLRGEMSLIGPRPHAIGTRAGGAAFESLHRQYPGRHRLRPGLTGLAQVRGQRGPLDSADLLIARTESDLDYVAGWSLRRDLAILARTVWVVLRMRNAY